MWVMFNTGMFPKKYIRLKNESVVIHVRVNSNSCPCCSVKEQLSILKEKVVILFYVSCCG